MRKAAFILSLLLLLALAAWARCWSLRSTFVDGRIYFADADCYSRMTRARMVDEGRAFSIRQHDFENYPQGTKPHTTAPLDWCIVLLRRAIDTTGIIGPTSILRGQTLDLAGALIAPLLGVLGCLAVALVLPRSHPGEGARVLAAAGFMAVSPIVVHGTQLGRPDHHALLVALLTFALAAEARLLRSVSRGWAIASGVAWGLAWWVSLYEPPILFAAGLAGLAVANRRAFGQRERWFGWSALLGVFVLGVIVDGWRLTWPDPALLAVFEHWSKTIGELHSLAENWRLAIGWLGWLCLLVPVGLVWRARADAESRWMLVIFVAAGGLAIWQLRWGYFLGIACALALPCALASPPRRWMGWIAFAVGIWPLAGDWDARLYPDEGEERRRYVERAEQKALREIAEVQRGRNPGPFVAPWWLSPALAYWSGQPGVAGSSHESLPGIVDTARIYLAPDAEAALPLLRERGVTWILSDDPERVIDTSATLLGVEPPGHCLAQDLNRNVQTASFTGSVVPDAGVPPPQGNQFFQVWRVRPDQKPAPLPE